MSIYDIPHTHPAAAILAGLPDSRSAASSSPAFTAVLHEGVEAVAASWQSFQDRGTCTAYQRLEWVRSIMARLMPHRNARPLIVEIVDRSSGQSVMLLPFALMRRHTHTAITWLDLGVCDYAAPLLAPGFVATSRDAQDAWAAALAVLPRVDLIQIDRIAETIGTGEPHDGEDSIPASRGHAPSNPLALLPQARRIALQAFGTPIDGPPETLLKRLCSVSTNNKFRRSNRKMEKAGEVRFVMARTEAEADDMFEALLDQRRQRFRDLGRFDLLDRPEVRDFYRDSVREGLHGGPARLFGLSVGGTWIATALGLVHGGTFHGILLAMDNAWRHCSPGLRIATDIMVWSRHEGLCEFDFTIGDLPYKAELGAKPHHLYEIAIARSLRGRLVLASSRLASDGKGWLQARPHLFEPLRQARQAMRRWGRIGRPS